MKANESLIKMFKVIGQIAFISKKHFKFFKYHLIAVILTSREINNFLYEENVF